MDTGEWVTNADLAREFGVTEDTMRRWARKYGLGINFKGPAGRRFSPADKRKLEETFRPVAAEPTTRRRRRSA